MDFGRTMGSIWHIAAFALFIVSVITDSDVFFRLAVLFMLSAIYWAILSLYREQD